MAAVAHQLHYKFHISFKLDNIGFDFEGFNDNLHNFITETIQQVIGLKDLDLSSKFEDAREELVSHWVNSPRHGKENMASNFDRILLKNRLQWYELFDLVRSLSYE